MNKHRYDIVSKCIDDHLRKIEELLVYVEEHDLSDVCLEDATLLIERELNVVKWLRLKQDYAVIIVSTDR